jgi:hypothetical protein
MQIRSGTTVKRFITYLFTYEKGVKGKNAGFIRVNQREGLLELEVHIQGLGRCQGKARVFLLVGNEGIPAGEFAVSQGRGGGRVVYEFHGDGGDAQAISGVAVRIGSQCYVASSWTDEAPEELVTGSFSVRSEEKPEESEPEEQQETHAPEPVQEAESETPDEPEPAQMQEADTPEPAEQPEADDPEPAQPPELSGTSADGPRRIDISDIRTLPKKNWYLCNNSFVIHGFFHYHYLIVAEFEEDGRKRTYLGVPGIYERPERMMAMLFGFPEFRTEAALNGVPEEDESEPIGAFGYWLCFLEA